MARKKKYIRDKAILQARKLFMKGFTFIEISELVGYAPRTVKSWAKNNNWKSDKVVYEMTDDTLKEMVMTAINEIKNGHAPTLPIKEIKELHRIYKELSQNKETFSTIIKVMGLFTDFVAKEHQAIEDKKYKEKHFVFMNDLSYSMEAFTQQYNKDHD